MARKPFSRRLSTYVTAFVVLCALVAAYFVFVKKEHGNVGAGVRVQSVKLKNGLKASREQQPTKLPYPAAYVTPVATYKIGPSGPLPAPMTVQLPVDADKLKLSSDEQPMIFTAESSNGPWETIPAKLAADGASLSFTTTHLSIITVAKVKIGDAAKVGIRKVQSVLGAVKETFNGLSDDVLVHAKPPKCDATSDALKDGYVAQPDKTSKSKDTILWCFGMVKNKSGKLVRGIVIVNNRTYPVTVTHPRIGVIEAGSLRGELSDLSRAISGKDSVVMPGEKIVIGPVEFPSSGGESDFHVSMDGLAQSLYALETGIRTAAVILTRFGAGTSSTVTKIIEDPIGAVDAMDQLLKYPDCFNAIRRGDANIGSILSGCLSANRMAEIFGKSAIFLAPIMVLAPVVKFFQSEFNALGDQFNHRDQYDLLVGRLNMDELCPSGVDKCYVTRQVDIDNNGALDSVAIYYDTEADDYAAKVIYDNGDVASARYSFVSPQDAAGTNVKHDPAKEHFSYYGFSDVNNDGHPEIFTKALLNGQWYIGVLGDIPNNSGMRDKDGSLFTQNLDGLSANFPLSTSEPFGIQAFFTLHKTLEAGGFQCSKDAGGHPLLMLWWVYDSRDGPHLTKSYMGLDMPGGTWTSLNPMAGVKLPKGYDGDPPSSVVGTIESLRAHTCPGLPRLPATGGTGSDAADAILNGAGVS